MASHWNHQEGCQRQPLAQCPSIGRRTQHIVLAVYDRTGQMRNAPAVLEQLAAIHEASVFHVVELDGRSCAYEQ